MILTHQVLVLIQREFPVYYRMSDIYYDIDTERQMAGLQSIINGYVIEIQMLEQKINEIEKQLDNIKKISSR